MTTPYPRLARPAVGLALAALVLGLALVALQFTSAARADGISCKDQLKAAPTGPATVAADSSDFGRVLVVGAGAYQGCKLYVLTSDQLHTLQGAHYACSDGDNLIHLPCDTVLWPALLTNGAPIAGPGVNPTLLGTVTRSDMGALGTVQQVTYAGQPLYRFFLDDDPSETEGVNLFDPVTDPTGTWELVDPSRGRPAVGTALIEKETAPVNGGADATVLAARMNNDFTLFRGGTFPVYTSSADSGHGSVCQAACAAVYWPPVLTDGRPQAGAGVDQNALGILVRPDGTHQVTYNGKPLYLFSGDAVIPALNQTQGINGSGLSTPWGVFSTIAG